MRTSSFPLYLLIAAALGLSAFGFLSWRAVSLDQADPAQAQREFAMVREGMVRIQAIVLLDESGALAPMRPPAGADKVHLSHIKALAYQADKQGLARVTVPFWFYKLKGPAIQLALHDTKINLKKLGVSAADLERHGPGMVLDESRTNGDQLMIWTD